MERRRCTAFALAAVLLGGTGTGVGAATESEKREEATKILADHFHQGEGREWVVDREAGDGLYWKYDLTDKYCGDIACWTVSLHVYPRRGQTADRIFLFSYENDAAFLGAEQAVNEWEDYDLVGEEGLERPCWNFCDDYGFGNEERIVIEHVLDPSGSLRVMPDDTDQIDLDGSIGSLARWDVHKIIERPEIPELVIPPGATPQIKAALEEQQAVLEEQAEEQEQVFFKFESAETGQYLRITSGDEVDARGTGGGWTLFRVHQDGDFVKFESKAFPGSYIAVDRDSRSVRVGTGGRWCRFKVFKE